MFLPPESPVHISTWPTASLLLFTPRLPSQRGLLRLSHLTTMVYSHSRHMMSIVLSDFFFFFGCSIYFLGASPMAQQKRIHLPVQETWVRSLGWEEPLEKETATPSSILGWEIPLTGSLVVQSPLGCKSQT